MADQLPITIRYKRVNNELVVLSDVDNAKLQIFIKGLEEKEIVDVTYEVVGSDGSVAQLRKLHKCIRELANYTGESFEDMKLLVKMQSGLCFGSECKSFSDCSKTELSNAIKATIDIGDVVGFNLHS